MDTSRNDLLGEVAADAALERTDFLASSSAQLSRFLDANESRIRELGGLVLIDDEVDYLAIAEDMSFRSRTRYLDEATGKWTSEMEVIESVTELVELYNPADIFASFGEATRYQAGAETEATEGDEEEAEATAARTGSLYAEAADDWAAGRDDGEAPETEDDAAARLYDLALAFQEKSQQTEAHLLEQFESAAVELAAVLGEFVVIDDEDERLTLRATGCFAAEVVPEDGAPAGEWRKLDSPDTIVEFYDPTDIFGDVADALAEAFPEVAGEIAGAEQGGGEPAEPGAEEATKSGEGDGDGR
jgi:hypothetical protein